MSPRCTATSSWLSKVYFIDPLIMTRRSPALCGAEGDEWSEQGKIVEFTIYARLLLRPGGTARDAAAAGDHASARRQCTGGYRGHSAEFGVPVADIAVI